MKMKTLIAVAVAGAFAIPFATQASVDGDRMIVAQAGGAGAPGGASQGSGAQGGAAGGAAAQSATPGAGSSTGQTSSGQPGTGAGLPPTDMQQLDANNDGYVSREEAGKNPSMSTRFSELDKDSDGRISKSEWEAGSGSAATGATGTTTSPSSATGSSDPARDVGTAASRPAPSTGSQTTK
jgi:hypothetical protein